MFGKAALAAGSAAHAKHTPNNNKTPLNVATMRPASNNRNFSERFLNITGHFMAF
jgi:hypothetical protein